MNLMISELIPSKANGGVQLENGFPVKLKCYFLRENNKTFARESMRRSGVGGWCKRKVSVRHPPLTTDAPPLHETPFALPARKVA